MSRRLAITYLLDSSFWLALVVEQHTFHVEAQAFFDQQSEPNTLLFCRATQHSFLRLITTNSVLRAYEMVPPTNLEAWKLYEAFVALPKVGFVSESTDVDLLWRKLSGLRTTSPKVWMDSYLAAFAIAHDYTLVTFDGDFRQYPGPKVKLLP